MGGTTSTTRTGGQGGGDTIPTAPPTTPSTTAPPASGPTTTEACVFAGADQATTTTGDCFGGVNTTGPGPTVTSPTLTTTATSTTTENSPAPASATTLSPTTTAAVRPASQQAATGSSVEAPNFVPAVAGFTYESSGADVAAQPLASAGQPASEADGFGAELAAASSLQPEGKPSFTIYLPGRSNHPIGVSLGPGRVLGAWVIWMTITLLVMAFWVPSPARRKR